MLELLSFAGSPKFLGNQRTSGAQCAEESRQKVGLVSVLVGLALVGLLLTKCFYVQACLLRVGGNYNIFSLGYWVVLRG